MYLITLNPQRDSFQDFWIYLLKNIMCKRKHLTDVYNIVYSVYIKNILNNIKVIK